MDARIASETARNYLDLVIFDRSGQLVPANCWQVFEERTFRGRLAIRMSRAKR